MSLPNRSENVRLKSHRSRRFRCRGGGGDEPDRWTAFAHGCRFVQSGLWIELVALGLGVVLAVAEAGRRQPGDVVLALLGATLAVYLVGGFLVLLGRWLQYDGLPPDGGSVSSSFLLAFMFEAARFGAVLAAGFGLVWSQPRVWSAAVPVGIVLRLLVDLGAPTNIGLVGGVLKSSWLLARVALLTWWLQLLGSLLLLVAGLSTMPGTHKILPWRGGQDWAGLLVVAMLLFASVMAYQCLNIALHAAAERAARSAGSADRKR